jgi:hypothetical protein
MKFSRDHHYEIARFPGSAESFARVLRSCGYALNYADFAHTPAQQADRAA